MSRTRGRTEARRRSAPTTLHQGLSQRQLNMIAIGGVIGAGLFVGSGVVIAATGPAAILTYAICGALIILVMRMLGEMATAHPSTGSFADYARDALGGWAGFSVGWLYWYFWVIVVGFEAVAGAKVLTYWFDAPLWLLSLLLMATMTATNLISVASFGEFEFWFAGIKVATILAFLGLGSCYALGIWPGGRRDFHHLTAHGFFPHGVGAVFAGIVVAIFSMVGAEVATIAAAETADPRRAVHRATNTVVARIAIFFVGSVFLLVVILPWNSSELGTSPYVAAFKAMGIPGADHLVNAVVLTAVLSCLNSGLYTASRMLFVLAARREAPAQLVAVSARGVPHVAILASSVVGFGCVLVAWIAPNTVFSFLLNSSGAVILFVYLLIALSQIVLRRRTPAAALRVTMWWFPGLSLLTAAGMVGVLVQMAFDRTARTQLWLSLLSWAVVLALYCVGLRWRGPAPTPEVAPTGTARRVLVLANQTLSATALLEELTRVDADHHAEYFLCVPANPIDTGQAEHTGPLYVSDATVAAAQQRLDDMLAALHDLGLSASGALGDHRPAHALHGAVTGFAPDQVVISTLPVARSVWLRHGLIEHARATYPIPITHVLADA
ncbi:amino acid permease [Mycobacterium sp. pUA109]|uniref:amino acid permease n=1 Tax=Mycobacterium sp. pUA109 TaxID=3238982 RepID=UPI00351BD848